MPSVNVRLSEEQHAELVKAGQRENRSLQREIIFRLFSGSGAGPSGVDQKVEPPAPGVNADAESRDVRARTVELGS